MQRKNSHTLPTWSVRGTVPRKTLTTMTLLMVVWAGQAQAHASEQALVLLLPTGMYIAGGVAAVVLTLLLIALVPAHVAPLVFRPLQLGVRATRRGQIALSSLAFIFMIVLLAAGLNGAHDPTRNGLSLGIWTLFWVGVVVLQGVFGNLWKWINPWTGPYAIVRRLGIRPMAVLPNWIGHWLGLASFGAISAVLLAHPAPADPDKLALMVICHWGVHFVGMLVFGPKWLHRAEGLTVLLDNYARVSVVGAVGGRLTIGIGGWKVLGHRNPGVSLAVFMVATLAVGSFDGLNETFWWFSQIGINPLEFPGRSAVIGENLAGLAFAVPALLAVYAFSVWIGTLAVGQSQAFGRAFCTFALAILPIALAYHFAHYLPSFLVEIQYVARLIAEVFDLTPVRVTTGFFNTIATVQIIWLAQAGAVVLGHVVAILLSHVLALKMFGSHRNAVLSQMPLAGFMVAYTLFGLWLLAVPRGA